MVEPTVEVPRKPVSPAAKPPAGWTTSSRRLLIDKVVRRLVSLGGLSIIVSILAILFVIVAEVWPLLRRPSARQVRTPAVAGGGKQLAVTVDEYRELAVVANAGGLRVIRMADGSEVPSAAIDLGAAQVVSASVSPGRVGLGLSDGRLLPVEVAFPVRYGEGGRHVDAELSPQAPLTLEVDGRPVRLLSYVQTASGPLAAGVVGDRGITLATIHATKALVGESKKTVRTSSLTVAGSAAITAVILDGRGESLFVGLASGDLLRYQLEEEGDARLVETVQAASRPGAAIGTLAFLIGDRTLIVGDAAGGVRSWQVLPDEQRKSHLVPINEFVAHDAPVIAASASRRDKGFITLDAGGAAHLSYGTTGKTLLVLAPRASARTVAFTPKADGAVLVDDTGSVIHWEIRNPHPETTLRSLFGKVWYEGYSQPEYVWQSTGGSDDFEAKFSLTPLLYGTLKGTFYALVLAIPLALLAALYTSQFMHPRLKTYVKPVVEIMAALPSVVLGFIAGLWLAPIVEAHAPALVLLPLVIALFALLSAAAWRRLPAAIRGRVRPGSEALLLIPVVLLAAVTAFAIGARIESALLGGDYRGWLLRALGVTYDQRNSLVVGLAMGFAVIPIIFTIAEDSLANVPRHLSAASLALGATRWQTAVRVVLPTGSPGIFSAIMIGFGRAVGETMIVLMATGNTPVMNWSPFNGFRALSANIAVELPEAPEGGSLYRVLFLAALLLFVMTFVVNTAAEIVRLRLRRKYRYL